MSRMKNWTFLNGDMNWEDYGARWCRQDTNGVWWVLDFANCEEWGGEGYECSVKRVDLDPSRLGCVAPAAIKEALASCGWTLKGEEVISDYDGSAVASGDTLQLCLLDALIGHGTYAPMGAEVGARAAWVRAAARRLADELMVDAEKEWLQLARPSNKLGSTALDFGSGDVLAGARRVASAVVQGGKVEVTPQMSVILRAYAAADGRTLGGAVETELAEAGKKLIKEDT